jgi:hypothetical protein
MARERSVSIIIEAKNRADAALSQVHLSLGKLAVAAGAATVAAGAVALAIAKVTEAAQKQEDADVRLAVALASIGENTAKARQSLGELASQLEKTTKQDDEAIQELMATLIQLGRVGLDQLPRVTKATIELAAVTRSDLGAAADLMAKAAQGNTTALKRWGIVLDESIPPGERFAALITLIEKNFAGVAEALGLTFSGSLKGLGNQWENFLQALGTSVIQSKALRDMLGDVSGALEDAQGWVETNRETIDQWVRSILRAVISLADLGVSTLNVASALAAIDLKVRSFTGKLTGASSYGEAVAGLDRAIIELAEKTAPAFRAEIERLRGSLDAADASAKKLPKTASDYLIVMHKVGETTVDVAEKIGNNFSGSVGGAKRAVEQFGVELSDLDARLEQLGAQTLPQMAEASALVDAAIAELLEASEAGFLSPEEFDAVLASITAVTEAIPQWKEDFSAANSELKAHTDLWKEVELVVGVQLTNSLLRVSDTAIDAALGAKVAWGEFFKSLLADIAKAIARLLIMQAIATAFPAFGKFLGLASAASSGASGTTRPETLAAQFAGGVVLSPQLELVNPFESMNMVRRPDLRTEPGSGFSREGNIEIFNRIEPIRGRQEEAVALMEEFNRLVESRGYRLVASHLYT